jgi:hypothetical protein
VKPEPPVDLWAQMDKVNAQLGLSGITEKTDDMFSAQDYALRYNLSQNNARGRVKKMIIDGHVEVVGMGRKQEVLYRFTK